MLQTRRFPQLFTSWVVRDPISLSNVRSCKPFKRMVLVIPYSDLLRQTEFITRLNTNETGDDGDLVRVSDLLSQALQSAGNLPESESARQKTDGNTRILFGRGIHDQKWENFVCTVFR